MRDFERADHAPRILEVDRGSRHGVLLAEQGRDRLKAFACDELLHLLAEGRVLPRLLELIVLEQGLDVEARAAGEDGHPALRIEAVDDGLGLLLEERHAVGLIGIADVDEVMRDALPLRLGRLGRADVEAAVDEHRVTGQDFRLERLCELDGERCLARSRRPEDDDELLAPRPCG